MFLAGVAHPVERHLAKVEVASSSLVTRSIKKKQMQKHLLLFYCGDRREQFHAPCRGHGAREGLTARNHNFHFLWK